MYRITNEIKGVLAFLANTRGIVPNPVDATRIYKGGSAVGVETTIIYTVPAGKVLFIHSANFTSYESVSAASGCLLSVRNGSDVLVYYMIRHNYAIAGNLLSHQVYLPAIEVPANYDVYISSVHANIVCSGDIFGWLEDA